MLTAQEELRAYEAWRDSDGDHEPIDAWFEACRLHNAICEQARIGRELAEMVLVVGPEMLHAAAAKVLMDGQHSL